MAISESFVAFVLDQLSSWGGVSVRKMFGGAGLYKEGKMFGLIAGDVAYLKVDESNRAQFQASGMSPFKPYGDKSTVMSYYEIPSHILEQPETLIEWAEQSLAIQLGKVCKRA